MLLIAEGPDGAGKSTLIAELQKLCPGSLVCHHGPFKGLDGEALAQCLLDAMAPALAGKAVLMDRCWYSELVYGPVHRGASRLSAAQCRLLERVALVAGARIVICLPPFRECAKAFLSGRDEMLDGVEQLQEVYSWYCKLEPRLPTAWYNYLVDRSEELFTRTNNLPTVWPRAVLLGDQPNIRTHAQEFHHVPFVSFTQQGCSLWLAQQLEDAGIPESWLEWHNVLSPTGEALAPECLTPDTPVIAMGTKALEWCAKNKVACQYFTHPQWHKRFHPREPYPLIIYLKEKFHGKEQSS